MGWDKPELDLSKAEWQSSSRGLGDVQIAFVEGFIAMRNSGRPESPSLIFTPAEWGAFISGARGGRVRPHLSRPGAFTRRSDPEPPPTSPEPGVSRPDFRTRDRQRTLPGPNLSEAGPSKGKLAFRR